PLTSISSLVQMLQRRDCDAYARDKLGLVSGELQRIQNILRELVNFSRPTSTERARVAVREVIDEAMNIAKYYKGARRRTIEVAVPDDLPCLSGARDPFVQAVLNLVLNAVDATEKGGRIEVRARMEAHEVVISVRDDGHGIAPEASAKLFQPYFTTKKHGTGLGLFVTRKLAADHGGVVEFDSEPGAGTEFRLRLPVRELEAERNGTHEQDASARPETRIVQLTARDGGSPHRR
ncbi:MAG: ATP-binding protein, partial [Planctomycetia bacterium]|nr:ATP-binding protein [Planctomycetia bacterium]